MTRVLLGTLAVSLLALASLVAFSTFNPVDHPVPAAVTDSDSTSGLVCPTEATASAACSETCCEALKALAAKQAPCAGDAAAKTAPCCEEATAAKPTGGAKPNDQ
jgi:hypothetical protein